MKVMKKHKGQGIMVSRSLIPVVGGAIASGGLLLLLDPKHGRTRRSRLVDQVKHATALVRKIGSSRAARVCASLSARGLGMLAAARGSLVQESVSDEVLIDRVRARLGHISPHLGQIEVTARNGAVKLEGSLPRVEREPLVKAAMEVPGVRSVIEQLGE